MSFEAIQITLLQNQNDSLKLALQQSQAHNAILIRHNQVLTELAANKTAYADQLRQALNAQRAGHPYVKVSQQRPRCCDDCRYLGDRSAANGWKVQCLAFGWLLGDTYTGAICPPECVNGPYLPREVKPC